LNALNPAARLLLLGRSESADATVESIRAAGGDALYVRCDVRDCAEVECAFEQARNTFGPITHVVHAAGILADESIASKDLDRAAAVFDTKVAGAFNLWNAAHRDPLQTFLMYGSWAGRFGNAHQSDYSAANHVLGRLTSRLDDRPGVRIATIDLPPWEGSGMDPLPVGPLAVGPLAASVLPAGVRARIARGINGLDIHVLEAGYETPDRPAVLLLHGFPELAYSWRKVMPALAAAGYHAIAPDQRGYGRTTGWDADYDGDLNPFRLLNMVRDAFGLVSARVGRIKMVAVASSVATSAGERFFRNRMRRRSSSEMNRCCDAK